MRLRGDDGGVLNAEFSVEVDAGHLGVVLESAGGRVPGSDRGRNHEYVPALELLLARLADRGAVLVTALVASGRVHGLPEAERVLLGGPVQLSRGGVAELRLKLTRAQGRIGQTPGATKEGNNRKRILLRVAVRGYGVGDADRLARDLAAPAAERVLPDAPTVLRGLAGRTIRTATGRPNTVGEIDGNHVVVRTGRSPSGRPVPIAHVQRGLDLLTAHGSVRVHPDVLGHRSTFVGAVLATLPGARLTTDPATVTLDESACTAPPEVVEAIEEADRLAGKPSRSGRGQGFRLTQAERDEVERHSMELAAKHLADLGFTVVDVSAGSSYDLDATKPGEHLHVEVKGTTSDGEEIILTRGEVELMIEQHPRTMLIVVRNVVIDRTGGTPRATGGELEVTSPWLIQPDNLTPISYRYRRPPGEATTV